MSVSDEQVPPVDTDLDGDPMIGSAAVPPRGHRDEVLQRLGLLDTPAEERFDRITRLAQTVFDVPYAFVNLVDSEGLFTKSQLEGQHFERTPNGIAFCDDTVMQSDILEIPDAMAVPQYADRVAVTEFGVRFYAGYPIQVTTGEVVGTLCVMATEPRTLDDEKRQFLEQLGRWAQAEIRKTDPATPELGADSATPSAPEADVAGDAADGSVEAQPHATPVRALYEDETVSAASLALAYGDDSGDLSAWRQDGRRFLVTLADVMGKGSAAGVLAHSLVSALHEHADATPRDAITAVEATLGAQLEAQDTFATVFHAVVDTRTGRIEYVDAGHGLNLHLASGGAPERLHSRNLPLGLRPPGIEWETGELTIGPEDRVLTVSDGVLDAYDSTLESLRLVAEDLSTAPDTRAFFDQLTARVRQHVVDDDVTAVVVSVH